MRLLLVVGTANDTFVYHMVRWLQKSMPVELELFEFWPSGQQSFETGRYCRLNSAVNSGWLYRGHLASFTEPFGLHRQLGRFLRGRHYDVIHCHWLSAPVVLTASLRHHCDRLFATFWGGELEEQKLLRSHSLYMRLLHRFMRNVSVVVNSAAYREKLQAEFPEFRGIYRTGNLGSGPMEELYRQLSDGDRAAMRRQWGIEAGKCSVLIGYSGKELHRHMEVVEAFRRHPEWRGRFHLLAPMTRSADPDYVDRVEAALAASGYSHTLVRDRFLTDGEMASLRCATDVVIQNSRFDGFSRSIIECLCAGSLLIYGEWLPYGPYLEEYGFYAVPVKDIADGVEQAARILDGWDGVKSHLAANSDSGRSRFLWSECIRDWVEAYQQK